MLCLVFFLTNKAIRLTSSPAQAATPPEREHGRWSQAREQYRRQSRWSLSPGTLGSPTNGQRLAKQCRPSQGGTGLSCLSLLPGTIWGFPKKGGPRKEGLSGSLLLPGTIWGFPEKEWPTNVRMARLFSAPVQPAG